MLLTRITENGVFGVDLQFNFVNLFIIKNIISLTIVHCVLSIGKCGWKFKVIRVC